LNVREALPWALGKINVRPMKGFGLHWCR